MKSSANTVNFYVLYVHMMGKHVIHAQLLKNRAMSYLTCILINFTYVCCCMPSTYINIYNIYYNLRT